MKENRRAREDRPNLVQASYYLKHPVLGEIKKQARSGRGKKTMRPEGKRPAGQKRGRTSNPGNPAPDRKKGRRNQARMSITSPAGKRTLASRA